MVMPPLQEQTHTDVPHIPNLNLMPKFWEIPDHIVEIMVQVLIILGIHMVTRVTTTVALRGVHKGAQVDNTLVIKVI